MLKAAFVSLSFDSDTNNKQVKIRCYLLTWSSNEACVCVCAHHAAVQIE